jgi:hypothetical protein
MKCECCHKEGFVYEKKVVDETFFICEDCDWSTADLEEANALGNFIIKIIEQSQNKRKI